MRKRDVAKAKALLKEAGVTGRHVIIVPPERDRGSGAGIQAMLAEAGIT